MIVINSMFSSNCDAEHDLCDRIDHKARRRTSCFPYIPGSLDWNRPQVDSGLHKPSEDRVVLDDLSRRSLTPAKCLEDERCTGQEEQGTQGEKHHGFNEIQRMKAIETAVNNLRGELYRINKMQQHRISERHRTDAESLHCGILNNLTGWEQKRERLRRALDVNIQQRKDVLEKYHEVEQQRLLSRHDEEVDDALVAMTKHLRCRENRQERERSILGKLKASQELELAALSNHYEDARDGLEFRSDLERKALEAGIIVEQSRIRYRHSKSVEESHQRIMFDRRWFEAVIEQRNLMVERYFRYLADGSKIPTTRATISED